MAYNRFLDSMCRALKIVTAIFLNPLWVVYRFIADIRRGYYGLVAWDAIFGIWLYPVFWIANTIWICKHGECFSFDLWFGSSGGFNGSSGGSTKETVEGEVVDHK